MEGPVIMPAVIMGFILGILEIEFVHNDERNYGIAWLGHALHAIPLMFIFVLISMNLHWAFGLVGINLKDNLMLDLGLRLAVGVLAMIKIMVASAILRGTAVGEKFPHAFILGLLVAASPYIWMFIEPFTKNIPWLNI